MTSDRGFTVRTRLLAIVATTLIAPIAFADPEPAAPGKAPPPISAGPAASAAPAANALTFEQAVQLALTRNERAAIADLNVVSAKAGVEKARVAFLPLLTASGSDTLKPWDKPRDIGAGNLVLSQPLFNPSAFPLYDQAKHTRDSTEAQTIDDKRQLAFDAAKAYVNVLLADSVVAAAQRKLDTSMSNLADTTAQFKAQLTSVNDVTRAQIDLADSQREIASDKGTLDAAYVTLSFTINAPVAPGLVPPTALLSAGEQAAPALDDMLKTSVAHRPDLVAKKFAADAAHDFACEPMWRLLPSFAVSATVTATSNPPTGSSDFDGIFALTGSWAIFDGGARYADKHTRDAAAAIADLTTDTLLRQIDEQVRSAAVQLASAQNALGAARDGKDASAKSADETAILYRQGLAKAIELVDANEQRFTAEVNYASAEYSVANAYLALRQALGLDPIGTELK
jgi:outer membrane protein TolC